MSALVSPPKARESILMGDMKASSPRGSEFTWNMNLPRFRLHLYAVPGAARSRVSKVLACTHSALMRTVCDPIVALSQGDDIEPVDVLTPASRIVFPIRCDAYCEPWFE